MIFDIHTHIVPAIDDGSRNYEESVQLIEAARSQGIYSIMATPHYYVNKTTDSAYIRKSVEEFNLAFNDVKIYPGNEVFYFDSMVEKLKSGEILTLADSRFVLIEFYPNESYQRIVRAVRSLRHSGYWPILAHVERFKVLKEKGLSELIDLGAYIQISLKPVGLGVFNRDCRFLRKCLKLGEVHFVGTDMHRIDTRPPVVTEAVKWIKKNIDNYEEILNENGKKILENRDFL